MSADKKKSPSRASKTQELHKKYPGHKPIPPSTRTVVIVLAATVVLSLLMVLLFYKNAQAPQAAGINTYTRDRMGTIKLS